MMYMMSTPPNRWRTRRMVMLWATLLFFTGMRPGEAAFSRRHDRDGHFLHVKVCFDYHLLAISQGNLLIEFLL